MAEFKPAFEKTLAHEGAYSNHPADKGGETYKGIARKYWPKWMGWKIVDEVKAAFPAGHWNANLDGNTMLQEFVANFYREQFWDKLKCPFMPQEIAEELFDTAVNTGVHYGSICLQKALNRLNRNGKDYPDLTEDGAIGNRSISALEAYYSTHRFNSRNKELLTFWLLKWMNFYQMKKYDDICVRNPGQEVFIPGWTNRV